MLPREDVRWQKEDFHTTQCKTIGGVQACFPACFAGAVREPTAAEPHWSERISKSLRMGMPRGEDQVFKRVMVPICLNHIKGTGLEEFVRLPLLTTAEGVVAKECLEFIVNWDSKTKFTRLYGTSLCLTKKIIEEVFHLKPEGKNICTIQDYLQRMRFITLLEAIQVKMNFCIAIASMHDHISRLIGFLRVTIWCLNKVSEVGKAQVILEENL